MSYSTIDAMRYHKNQAQSGKVSIWVGDVTSEDELIEYVDDGGFAADFDYEPYPPLGREIATNPAPVPIGELVEGFSSWSSFADQCRQAASTLGISSSCCMVVLYNSAFEPSTASKRSARLRFLGSFNYQ